MHESMLNLHPAVQAAALTILCSAAIGSGVAVLAAASSLWHSHATKRIALKDEKRHALQRAIAEEPRTHDLVIAKAQELLEAAIKHPYAVQSKRESLPAPAPKILTAGGYAKVLANSRAARMMKDGEAFKVGDAVKIVKIENDLVSILTTSTQCVFAKHELEPLI